MPNHDTADSGWGTALLRTGDGIGSRQGLSIFTSQHEAFGREIGISCQHFEWLLSNLPIPFIIVIANLRPADVRMKEETYARHSIFNSNFSGSDIWPQWENTTLGRWMTGLPQARAWAIAIKSIISLRLGIKSSRVERDAWRTTCHWLEPGPRPGVPSSKIFTLSILELSCKLWICACSGLPNFFIWTSYGSRFWESQ